MLSCAPNIDALNPSTRWLNLLKESERNFMSRCIYLLILACLWGVPSALAQTPWSVEATYNVPVGKMGKLTFKPNIALASLKMTLSNDSSVNPQLFSTKRLGVGQSKVFSFKVPEGRTVWTALFQASTKDSALNSTFKFEVISVRPLRVNLEKSGVDLVKGRLHIKTNQALMNASLRGFNPQGELVLDANVDLPQRTGVIPIDFTPLGDNDLRRMEIKVTDAVGRWIGFRLVAWYVEIPHDDVIFQTGSASVEPSEAGKLDAVVKRVKAEVQAFRKTLGRQDVGLNLKLYVVGCTDTVGSPTDNLNLSRRRARSIAEYFRQRGVSAPIFYEGYGEGLLAIATGDNVEEAKNRRAIYVLTNTEPSDYSQSGRRWYPLK